ncbi:hypothetical protein [Streptomyces finlayi]|uniref:hypothetical protein n=1 Tax=Streptomyces finlayi TaxID=67296 RepID=UPI0021564513|nr:hypothetical protein [Streptomyces finlayi]
MSWRTGFGSPPVPGWISSHGRAQGDAFCFVGEGAAERPVMNVGLDGEAGPLALGLDELVRLCLMAPW